MAWWTHKRDAKLYAILSQLPTFDFYSMLRADTDSVERSKQRFFESNIPPSFTYSRAENANTEKYTDVLHRVEEKLNERLSEGPLKRLYIQKIDELKDRVKLVNAIKKKNDHNVHEASILLFGSPQITRIEIEDELREMKSDKRTLYVHSKPVSAEHFAKMIAALGQRYDFDNIRVDFFEGTSIKIRHNLRKGISTVYIPKNRDLSKARAARLLTHEIEVHALRRENGLESPYAILGHGLDRYLQTEEGLALYFQKQLRSKHAHDPGIWDAYTVLLTNEYGFADVFNAVFEAKRSIESTKNKPAADEELKESVWNLCRRAYRGIHMPAQEGVGYVRDHVYRSGLKRVEAAIHKEGESIIDHLFVGRVGLQHLSDLKTLDLPKPKIPEMLGKEVVAKMTKTA